MRRDSWQPLINDDDNVGVLIPIIPILLAQQEQDEHAGGKSTKARYYRAAPENASLATHRHSAGI